jgi:SAM-dependent methyltransferase
MFKGIFLTNRAQHNMTANENLTLESQICVVCGASDWLMLPDPDNEQSVTTGGRIIAEGLGKSHCRSCGLVQRTRATLLAKTDFYETRYSFYNRPGANRFDRERYAQMAAWIRASLPITPVNVLDAGCGRGWMLEAMVSVLPSAHFRGIEPSETESENARRLGFDVVTGRVGSSASAAHYDLVYSTNVLEHTDAPLNFLIGLRELMAADGRIVITCPDASHPGSEMLFADQNFSFLPEHLEALAARAGLEVDTWAGPPAHVSLRDKQLVVLRQASAAPAKAVTPQIEDSAALYERRRAYLQGWEQCGERLARECRGAGRVYHFGTSTWSFLLAAYCPEYWSQVTSCIIDGGSGEFFGKPVADAESVTLAADDVIVFGVDPDRQAWFAERFVDSPSRAVLWNDLVRR